MVVVHSSHMKSVQSGNAGASVSSINIGLIRSERLC